MWYAIFDGIKWSENYYFTSLNGTINQTLWNSLPQNYLKIRFYVKDKGENIAFKEITIIKSITYDKVGGAGGNDDDDGGLPPEEIPLIALLTIVGGSVAAGCIVLIIAWKKQVCTKFKRT